MGSLLLPPTLMPRGNARYVGTIVFPSSSIILSARSLWAGGGPERGGARGPRASVWADADAATGRCALRNRVMLCYEWRCHDQHFSPYSAHVTDVDETMADEVAAIMLGAELAQLLDEVAEDDTQSLAPEDRDALLARQMATAFGLPSLPAPPPRQYSMPSAEELIDEMVERIVADWSPLAIINRSTRNKERQCLTIKRYCPPFT